MAQISKPQTSLKAKTSTTGTSGIENLRNAGNMITNTGIRFQQEARKSFEFNEYNKVSQELLGEYNKRYAQRLERKFDNKGNPTYGSLVQDVESISNEILDSISTRTSNENVKNQLKEYVGKIALNRQADALSESITQHRDYSKAKLQETIDSLVESALVSDVDELSFHEEDINSRVNNAVNSGVLTLEKGNAVKDAVKSKLRMSKLYEIADNNPDAAIRLSESDTLGVSFDEREKVTKYANQRKVEIKKEIEEREQEELRILKEEQNTNNLFLELEIEKGVAGESTIQKAFDDGMININQMLKLKKKVVTKNKQSDTDNKVKDSITDSISTGKAAIGVSDKDIDNHYKDVLTKATKGEQDRLSLTQKSQAAVLYNQPVKAFQKDLQIQISVGTAEQKAEALRVFEFVNLHKPEVLSGMDNDDFLILSTANRLVDGTDLSEDMALEIATEKYKSSKDPIIAKSRKEEYLEELRSRGSGDRFATQEASGLRDIIGDMYENFFFSNPDVDNEVLSVFGTLLERNYIKTGDFDTAIHNTKEMTKNLYRTTDVFNQGSFRDEDGDLLESGGDKLMFLPPEAIFPEREPEEMYKTFKEDIEGLVPPNTDLDNDVFIRSDKITRRLAKMGLGSWGVYIKRDGEDIPLIDINGEPVRFLLGAEDRVTEAKEERLKLLKETEQRKKRISNLLKGIGF